MAAVGRSEHLNLRETCVLAGWYWWWVDILGSNSEVTDKPTYPTTNSTFKYSSFSEMGRKSKMKMKVHIPRQQKLCVVRRERSLLDEISTNGKRVREVECEIYLPVSLNKKKLKVSPMCTPNWGIYIYSRHIIVFSSKSSSLYRTRLLQRNISTFKIQVAESSLV